MQHILVVLHSIVSQIIEWTFSRATTRVAPTKVHFIGGKEFGSGYGRAVLQHQNRFISHTNTTGFPLTAAFFSAFFSTASPGFLNAS